MKAVIVSKIRTASSAASFADDPEVGFSLQAWKAWGGTSEPAQWATALCGSPSGLLKFLRAFRAIAHSQGSSPLIKQHEFFVLAKLAEFVELSALRAETGKLVLSSLTDHDKNVVALFPVIGMEAYGGFDFPGHAHSKSQRERLHSCGSDYRPTIVS